MEQKSNIKKEDRVLLSLAKSPEERNWDLIAEELLKKGFDKTSKQCKER